MRSLFLTLVVLTFSLEGMGAVTVDRIVVSIGIDGITQSDIEQEVRFARFLDGLPQTQTLDAAHIAAARDRLVEQALLYLEAEAEGADAVGVQEEAARMVEEVRKLYPDEAAYRAALVATGYSEDQMFQRLTRNIRIVRLIDRRLRPNAWIERPELEAYYEKTFVPEHQKREQTPPPKLEEVESLIREILTQQEVDQLLDQWLKEIQITRRVRIHSF